MSLSPFDPLLVLLIRPSLFVIPVWVTCRFPAIAFSSFLVPFRFGEFTQDGTAAREKGRATTDESPHIEQRSQTVDLMKAVSLWMQCCI